MTARARVHIRANQGLFLNRRKHIVIKTCNSEIPRLATIPEPFTPAWYKWIGEAVSKQRQEHIDAIDRLRETVKKTGIRIEI